MAPWVTVLLTLVITFLTFLVWKTYERISWFTGSMETHSDLMLRIEARRGINGEPIKLLWWDPTTEDTPAEKKHGQEIDLNTIYIYLPPNMRRHKPTRKQKMKAFFSLP